MAWSIIRILPSFGAYCSTNTDQRRSQHEHTAALIYHISVVLQSQRWLWGITETVTTESPPELDSSITKCQDDKSESGGDSRSRSTGGTAARRADDRGRVYQFTCSSAPPGSFHFVIYGLAWNHGSRTFQVNKQFPAGCFPSVCWLLSLSLPLLSPRLLCKQPVLCRHDCNHLKVKSRHEKNTSTAPYCICFQIFTFHPTTQALTIN